MIQIGIRAHDMEKLPFELLVEAIAKKGFKCTQLALSKAIYEFATDTQAMTPGMALYMKRIFAKYDVDVAALGCYLNLGTPDKEELLRTQKIYEAHIRFASLLGCGVVGTETGAVNKEYRYVEENKSEEAFNTFIENIRPVVEYAEKMGVVLGIEPVATHIIYDMKRARRMLDVLASPNVKLIFDPVNLLTIDNYQQQGDIIDEAINLCQEDIVVLHAKDFIVENNKIVSVISGDGMLDYIKIMNWVNKSKPYMHVLLEETNPNNVMNAKEFVEVPRHSILL